MLPRFTLRTALLLLTSGALLALVIRQALAHQAWAIGMLAAIGSIPATLIVHGMLYAITRLFSPPAAKPPASSEG